VADALGERLYGVRLDTSETMVDLGLIDQMGDSPPTGVNAALVRHVRNALDAAGYKHVALVASGGFDAEKIRRFQDENVPVDMYGVGSSLLRDRYQFTADIVIVNGTARAKAGRWLRPSARLDRVR
jgi:nicotinate phosphoribosyltransferase